MWLLWHRGLPRTLESLTDISITPVVSALCLRKQNREGHETVTFGGPRKKFIIANVRKARLTIIFTKSICNFYQSYLQADSADSSYLLTMWVCTTGRTIEFKQILNKYILLRTVALMKFRCCRLQLTGHHDWSTVRTERYVEHSIFLYLLYVPNRPTLVYILANNKYYFNSHFIIE